MQKYHKQRSRLIFKNGKCLNTLKRESIMALLVCFMEKSNCFLQHVWCFPISKKMMQAGPLRGQLQHSHGKLVRGSHGGSASNLYASAVSSFSPYNRTSATLKISSHSLLKTIILYFLSCFKIYFKY